MKAKWHTVEESFGSHCLLSLSLSYTQSIEVASPMSFSVPTGDASGLPCTAMASSTAKIAAMRPTAIPPAVRTSFTARLSVTASTRSGGVMGTLIVQMGQTKKVAVSNHLAIILFFFLILIFLYVLYSH